MFGFIVFTLAVMAFVLHSGYSLGELSMTGIMIVLALWMALLATSAAAEFSAVLAIVGTVATTIGLVLRVFGGDIRI